MWIGLFEGLVSLSYESSVCLSDLALVLQNGLFKVDVDAVIVIVSHHRQLFLHPLSAQRSVVQIRQPVVRWTHRVNG